MRVLLLEGNEGNAELVREAIHEIEEIRRWRGWVRHIELVHLERLEEAIAVLAAESFDAALAGSVLPDAQGVDILLALRAQAPEMPVILLVSDEEDSFAVSAVREGADDCLPYAGLECAPLARALRMAVERQRRLQALHSSAMLDLDTGIFNREGFLTSAERDVRIAGRLGRSAWLLVAALDSSREDVTLGLYPAAELAASLRLSFLDTDLVARLDARHFAVLSFCADAEDLSSSVSALRDRLPVRLRTTWIDPAGGWTIAELLDQAVAALCENGPGEPAVPDAVQRATA
jgi:two-component system cell cycle response regulator